MKITKNNLENPDNKVATNVSSFLIELIKEDPSKAMYSGHDNLIQT